MKNITNELLKRLPKSKTELIDRNTKLIYEKIPVPNDYHILWADVRQYKNCPSATVITKEALIVKFNKKETKQYYNEKDSFYRIIPWRELAFEDIKVLYENDNGISNYTLKINDIIVTTLNKDEFCKFIKVKSLKKNKDIINILENVASETVFGFKVRSSLWDSINLNIYNTTTGHGIYAEKAGILHDKMHLKKASHEGANNAPNGPDKIVNGKPIQCKYCKTANKSVNAAFDKKGMYRYKTLGKEVMQLEVPKDQYEKAIDIMKEKITNGKVEGITNPDEAYSIIRKGSYTYKQVKDMAKAGTIESLKYDFFTGSITALSTAGLSTLIEFAQCLWSAKDLKIAFCDNYKELAKAFGITVGKDELRYVIANQLLKSKATVYLKPGIKRIVEKLPDQIKNNLANSDRILRDSKSIYGGTADNALVKKLTDGTIMCFVSLGLDGAFNYYNYANKKISSSQVGRNMVDSVGALAGGAAGAELGRIIPGGPKIKMVGTVVGGMIGGFAGSVVGKVAMNLFTEDDGIVIRRMFESLTVNYANEMMLTGIEFDEVIRLIDEKYSKEKNITKNIYSSNSQAKYITDTILMPSVKEVISRREKITKEDTVILNNVFNKLIKGEAKDEM